MKNKLTLLGTGSFYVTKDRSASAYLLEAGDTKILIDCGPGTLMRLSQAGFKVEDIDYVLITHFHPDHTSDLFPLFMNFRLNDLFSGGKLTKFPKFIGPRGIEKLIMKYSKLTELHSVQGWDKIEFLAVKNRQVFGDIVIDSFKVTHKAFSFEAKAYSYRLTIGNKIISFSGDSANCSGLAKACKGADIFVCDASFAKGNDGGVIHINTHEIGLMATKSGVKKLVLSHFYPQNKDNDMVNEVKEKFEGEIIAGKDLMSFKF